MFSRRKKSPRPQEGHKKNDLSNLVLYISYFFFIKFVSCKFGMCGAWLRSLRPKCLWKL